MGSDCISSWSLLIYLLFLYGYVLAVQCTTAVREMPSAEKLFSNGSPFLGIRWGSHDLIRILFNDSSAYFSDNQGQNVLRDSPWELHIRIGGPSGKVAESSSQFQTRLKRFHVNIQIKTIYVHIHSICDRKRDRIHTIPIPTDPRYAVLQSGAGSTGVFHHTSPLAFS